jgi:hypothetical protein
LDERVTLSNEAPVQCLMQTDDNTVWASSPTSLDVRVWEGFRHGSNARAVNDIHVRAAALAVGRVGCGAVN